MSTPPQGDDRSVRPASVSSTTTSAARAADVLLHFADGPKGVSRIARELNLSKAVVHRIVTTFVDRGLLVLVNPGREYALGPAAAALGVRALSSSPLREVARPALVELHQRTGETATVSALAGNGRLYLDQVESRQEIKMTVELGRRFPLHAGSSSRVILAFATPSVREQALAGPLDNLTDNSIVEDHTLRESLIEIRERGWCMSAGERQSGASSVAAPIFDFDGFAVGALSVCGPIHRMDEQTLTDYAPAVVAAADAISMKLGWRGGRPDLDDWVVGDAAAP